MANVMTPNKNQLKFTNVLKKSIGINRKSNICPYEKFGFLNSGSEAIELATKICDSIYKDSKKESIYIVLEGSFHGRTGNASKLSDSCKNNYQSNLKSFQHKIPVYSVPINNIQQFITTFNLLKAKYTIEAVFFEPVMGEGNPGIQLNKEFYHIARKMTKENKSLLIIDSIQAGIRTNGYLSIVDYPTMKDEDSPDMEIFSKAVNSGQYPLSVLAVSKEISDQFKTGIYGNTMTGNPKAMDIGIETLIRLNDDVRKNIILKGYSFFYMLQKMKNNYPYIVEKITGQGLLLAMHIKKEYKVIDSNKGLEYICRKNGLNVIHGGNNALRFTPYFLINDDEIDLVHKILEESLDEYTNRFIRKII
jgi:acetylornithine/succinyldiaminopimelate/putrescine aminotransferase